MVLRLLRLLRLLRRLLLLLLFRLPVCRHAVKLLKQEALHLAAADAASDGAFPGKHVAAKCLAQLLRRSQGWVCLSPRDTNLGGGTIAQVWLLSPARLLNAEQCKALQSATGIPVASRRPAAAGASSTSSASSASSSRGASSSSSSSSSSSRGASSTTSSSGPRDVPGATDKQLAADARGPALLRPAARGRRQPLPQPPQQLMYLPARPPPVMPAAPAGWRSSSSSSSSSSSAASFGGSALDALNAKRGPHAALSYDATLPGIGPVDVSG
jgi:hypothetical protein